MALDANEQLHSYILLHKIFPDDLHIARPLIQMLLKKEQTVEARSLAMAMARRMLASGKAAHAIAFLSICKQLQHPNMQEIDALSKMARITQDSYNESANGIHRFGLINQLSDSEALDFIGESSLIRVKDGHRIVSQGEASETFYLILTGFVDVSISIEDGSSKTLKTLVAGDFFGEFACIYKLRRSATVTATGNCLLLEFSGNALAQLMEHFPMAGDYLIRTVQTRMIHAMTHSNPAFSELPEADKLWAAEESSVLEYQQGDLVATDQQDHRVCHIILSGDAACRLRGDEGEQTPSAPILMGSGSIFGNASPYIQLPANSELTAQNHLLVCQIPEKIFLSFMNVYASFEHHVKQPRYQSDKH